MNSSLKKALIASMLVVGGSVSALGQGFDYDAHCIDANNTAPYSSDFNFYYLDTPLWSAGLGIAGTVHYNNCIPGSSDGGTFNVAGRFAWGPGTQGSIQDDLRVVSGEYDVSPDNLEDFQWAQNHGYDPDGFEDEQGFGGGAQSGSGWSFARIQIQGSSDFLFGGSTFEVAYVGASNRYFTATQINSGTSVTLQIDVVGDASRFQWLILNNTAAIQSYGLELGQWVVPTGGYLGDYVNVAGVALPPYPGMNTPVDNYGFPLGYNNSNGYFQPYVSLPAIKPRETDTAFFRTDTTTPFPAYVNFTGGLISEFNEFGLNTVGPQSSGGEQIVNSPYANVEDGNGNSDQTPVDEFDVGDVTFLLDGNGLQNSPTFGNVLFNDSPLDSNLSFAQKWYYSSTPVGEADTIVCYYRSIWGDSNYFDGYTGVVDTPKVLSPDLTTTPYKLSPNPFTVEVDIDNTGVFGYEYQQVNMNSVEVQLSLPPGMYPAGGSPTQTTMTQYISSGILSRKIGKVDFLVAAQPYIFGPQKYTVTITPTPGTVKVIQGSINVSATPTLQLVQGANLVGEPWNFAQQDWGDVLGLTPVSQFQAYNWDPLLAEYIPSSGPQREIGTWIVANNPPTGFFNLGGSPSAPADEFPSSSGALSGAPNLKLQEGWNLIANPYNYSFPLGQFVGVPASGGSDTYDNLVAGGVIDGSFAYYDPNLQTYDYIGQDTDELLPNHGYWVYCTQAVTLVFPPVYDLFVRAPAPTFQNYANHWKFQISAKGSGCQDLNSFYTLDTIPGEVKKLILRKPPINAAKNAIRAFVTGSGTSYNGSSSYPIGSGVSVLPGRRTPRRTTVASQYAMLASATPGKQVFNYSVFPTQSGPVTLSWPNLSALPKNLAVSVKDLTTGGTTNARSAAGYNFNAEGMMTRTFQFTITPESTARQAITNVSWKAVVKGAAKQMTIDYTTASGGIANLALLQNGVKVANIISNQSIVSGKNVVTWGMMLKTGMAVKRGTYTLAITAVGDGGDVASKNVTLNL
jgi:hypothetical protein